MADCAVGALQVAPRGGRRRVAVAFLVGMFVWSIAQVGAGLQGSPGAGAVGVSRLPAPAPAAAPTFESGVARVVITTAPDAIDTVSAAVRRVGGRVVQALRSLNMITADVPMTQWSHLVAAAQVKAIATDTRVQLHHAVNGYDPGADVYGVRNLAHAMGAREFYDQGYSGQGVDIALIDSGVAPVTGLDLPGKVVHGPDLSFESQAAESRFVDTFGHGTHMASIIAGRDSGSGPPVNSEHHVFAGVAPGARLISLKVADAYGATDVSQVLAAVDWVVQHRADPGMNIRVLNLSFGTDGTQHSQLDPLAHAAEVAWRHGIVVVVAAGNDHALGRLSNPATNPFVIAVGAQDTRGTQGRSDDTIPAFSSSGDGVRNPDVVAPGVSIAALRAPDSTIDVQFSTARVGQRYFRGSGTSQAAAMVSGATALLLQRYPGLTPDEVKRHLQANASPLAGIDVRRQGAGSVNLDLASRNTPERGVRQSWTPATGTGTLQGARGSLHLERDGEVLQGEQDIFGAPFDAAAHAAAAEAASAWSGGDWNGGQWSGSDWSGSTWQAVLWTRSSWSRSSWSNGNWNRSSWSRSSWSGVWATGGWQ